jgi:hypothetical protein
MTRHTDLACFLRRDERLFLLAFAYLAVLNRQSRLRLAAGKRTRRAKQLRLEVQP